MQPRRHRTIDDMPPADTEHYIVVAAHADTNGRITYARSYFGRFATLDEARDYAQRRTPGLYVEGPHRDWYEFWRVPAQVAGPVQLGLW